ncbi:amidase [Streptomyces sp. E-08]|uniref:amidase n=1 Tax=Streptomyces sp. E-08 TaxID=3404047 RepID=UPI003CEE5139
MPHTTAIQPGIPHPSSPTAFAPAPPAATPPPGPAEGLPRSLALPLAERARLLAIGELNPVTWRAEANAWARTADERYRATTALRALRPTDGDIRLGVKDMVDVAGFATRLGLRRHRHHPDRTAPVVQQLRGVAAIAKLVTPELGIGLEHGCRNPAFPHLGASGSSTGSAVAVASHLTDIALGTDTVASIRMPAAACGVVGLRTTYRPHLMEGVFPLSPLLDACGWFARTADDLAYFWDRSGLAGRTSVPPATYGRTYRVGVVREALDGPNASPVRDGLDTFLGMLSDAGHELVPLRLGALWEQRAAVYELCAYEAWHTYERWRGRFDDELAPATRLALEAGADIGPSRYREIRAALEHDRGRVGGRFAAQDVDVWLMPVAPGLPRPAGAPAGPVSAVPRPGEPDFEQRVGYCPLAAWAGLPALAFPVAVDPVHGAPVALQAVGPAGSEAELIRFGRQAARLIARMERMPRAHAPARTGRTAS